MTTELLAGKLLKEFRTITAMVEIYCKAHCHAKGDIQRCQECNAFLQYAQTKLDRCPYGQNKPACNQCPIHCYKPALKIKAQQIMRFSGPKMLLPHPIMAVRHLLATKSTVVKKPPKECSNRHLRLAKQKLMRQS